MSHEIAGSGLPAKVSELIGVDLNEVERIFAEELSSRNPYVKDILEHVNRFRGKRLRPMLLLLTAKACGESRREHHVLASVLEMIHMATLIHDDVLDEAETRRHVATVNTRWNNESSVLFGDFLFTHSFHLASSLGSTLACRMIGRSTNIVCEGELTQIRERGNFLLSEKSYLEIINRKTAELCALACFLGAHFAGQNEEVTHAMQNYGRSLGIAFQIADDLLDILGTETETGKTLGSDIVKQKMTLPFIRLFELCNEEEQSTVRNLMTTSSTENLMKLERMLQDANAIEYARQKADEYTTNAREQLDVLPNSSVAKELLIELTYFVTQRSF